jgi:cytochrome c-type biogenesis protein CcmH
MSAFVLPAALLVLLAVASPSRRCGDRRGDLAIVLAVALPIAAAALYLWKGTPQALDATPAVARATPALPGRRRRPGARPRKPRRPRPARRRTGSQARRRSLAMGRLGAARPRAHGTGRPRGRAATRSRRRTRWCRKRPVGVFYAEALMRTSGRPPFPPEAVAMLEHAAKAQPPTSAACSSSACTRCCRAPGEAADLGKSLLPLLDENAANALRPQIAAARKAAGQAPDAVTPDAAAAGGASIAVSIAPAPGFEDRAKAGSILFRVRARERRRAAGGGEAAGGRSLAGRADAGDGDSPMPAAKLSTQEEVLVVARLSNSGNAIAASGDLESAADARARGRRRKVALSLDRGAAVSEFIPPATRFAALPSPFAMKRGGELHGARVAYETWGTLERRARQRGADPHRAVAERARRHERRQPRAGLVGGDGRARASRSTPTAGTWSA